MAADMDSQQERNLADREHILDALSRALGREAYNLQLWPSVTQQQLYNDACHFLSATQAADLRKRVSADSWCRVHTPPHTSPALIRTIRVGGTIGLSPNGSFAVSVADGIKRARVWDILRGTCRFELKDAGTPFAVSATSIVTYSDKGALQIWDAENGTERAFLSVGHAPGLLQFGADGGVLVSFDWAGDVEVWDTDPFARRLAMKCPREMTSLDISRDGSFLIAGSALGVLTAIDLRSGYEIFSSEHDLGVNTCAISPDQRVVASAGLSGDVHVWDIEKGAPLLALRGHEGMVEKVVFSPDARHIFSVGFDGNLMSWELIDGTRRFSIDGDAPGLADCAISLDGKVVATAGGDGNVRLWDTDSGIELAFLFGHVYQVQTCEISPDSSIIASCGFDETIRVWDANSANQLGPFIRRLSVGCQFDPGGSLIIVSDEGLTILDTQGSELATYILGELDEITSWAISPDRTIVALGTKAGTLALWDVTRRRERLRITANDRPISSCAVSRDGLVAVAGSEDLRLTVWDVESATRLLDLVGQNASPAASKVNEDLDPREVPDVDPWRVPDVHFPELPDRITACAVNNDGALIVSVGTDSALRFWDGRTGDERARISHRGTCALSPDERFGVSAGESSGLLVWEPLEGRIIAKLAESGVTCVAIAPDSSFIVSGHMDGGLRIWESASWSERARLPGHRGNVSSCDIGGSGRLIVSGGGDGIRVWDSVSGIQLSMLPLDHYHPIAVACAVDETLVGAVNRLGLPIVAEIMGRSIRIQAH